MDIVCLDLEGVLVPEIWIEFSQAVGIPALARTTRDEPDYAKLMQGRLDLLDQNGFTIDQIQQVIEGIDPMPGAAEFLDRLRSIAQVIIISDTFSQFAHPLMRKLAWPTILCNELEVGPGGRITGYRMRVQDSKRTTVRALHQAGLDTIAVGDSFNDLGMIEDSKAGFFFRTTDHLKATYPDVPSFDEYADLLDAIQQVL